MKIYSINAEVLDDICIVRSQSATNLYETMDHIPGRIIWGALAGLTGIAPGQKPPDEFMEVFYSNKVMFTNLYPSALKDKYKRTFPVPLSARTKKSAPGFKNDKCLSSSNGWGGGVCDWLIDGEPEEVESEEWKQHPCFYKKDRQGNYETIKPPLTYSIHHERDNMRGTTKEGRLFSRVNIARGTRFVGYLKILGRLSQKGVELLNDLQHKVEAYPELYIGRKPGRIKLEISEIETSEVNAYYNDVDPPDEHSNGKITFTITCYSDTIITEDGEYFRYLSYIPDKLIERELKVIENCTLKRWFSSTTPVHGWHGVYRRPAEVEIAIQRGSAFLYEAEVKDKVDRRALQDALKSLQFRGIGLRRAEGFGEIKINDPFHKELAWRSGECR